MRKFIAGCLVLFILTILFMVALLFINESTITYWQAAGICTMHGLAWIAVCCAIKN